jgi:hypothetical protein
MKKRLVLFVSVLVAPFLIGATSWAAGLVTTAPAPTTLKPIPLNPAVTTPIFTSTIPSPVVLIAGREIDFTITGAAMGYVRSLALINPRMPLWRLPVNIVSRNNVSITARVVVPKFLASGPYQIQALTGTGVTGTALTAQAAENKPCAVWTEFNPGLHGFAFPNDPWNDVCYTIVGGRMEYSSTSPLCGSNWGLCGGMSLNAGERFRFGVPGTHDLTRDAAKPAVVDGQFRTLDGPTIAKFFEWMYSPDVGSAINPYHSVGYRMQQDWNGVIKPQLDAYRPVVLGLIFDKKATLVSQLDPTNVLDLTKQHQVLGIGYSRIGASTVRICAYDPNVPDDILILTFEAGKTGVTQALDSGSALPQGRRPARGVMFIRSAP